MEKDKFINQIIKASIDGYLAGFGKVKNKKDFLKLESSIINIIVNFGFNKDLAIKTVKKMLINFSV
ncbi:MAG: hypothetical protein PHH06_01895 [Candidatus Gracilibacteria bacterium]|nr:hypothetical protein [Candidatus Gracilibacteria bacterium]